LIERSRILRFAAAAGDGRRRHFPHAHPWRAAGGCQRLGPRLRSLWALSKRQASQSHDGKTFILTSIDVKKVKYPIIGVDADGKCYKLPAHQIFALLRTQSADRASAAPPSANSSSAAAAAASANVKLEVKAEVKPEIKAEVKAEASAAAAAFPTFGAISSNSSGTSEGPPRKKAKHGLTREQRIFAIEMLLENHNEEVVPECRGNDSKLEAHFKRAFGSSIAEVFAEGEEDYDRDY
jgi:hypothetical protein